MELETYECRVHFGDTDAAGVVYFANVLRFCHEAYENLLQQLGVDLRQFFSGSGLIVPITDAQIRFLKPLYCGDRLRIIVTPEAVDGSRFQLGYRVLSSEADCVAVAQTHHVCLALPERHKAPLPPPLADWLTSEMRTPPARGFPV
ncbi:acyl-CoA thioesterase [Synechococcus sp. PCC 6717]|jgi:1,4-dihydroxy-2-naphthoyl-CoA hydrolase|uniref:1,4-dihydroxy-2-naphthoyl-CoA hydrolase n=1 Tax=Parathermosynechococcus lividus PCC 6715 TaxID=1917166 RepID=A0A2D2Q107_PARLV|nr:thioesterase family protein [Thermostichus lividus]ATS18184.1 1,4-dihydroxy-2-naphthoyl-CoA hydrolase [Thermostichus lividus PCC 6715]MCI3279744.1 acyl-CoA thioesterase [Synechococcus sp. PCC 6717]